MNPILQEVTDKFGEWLEMAGENSPALIIDILSTMLKREREQNDYFQRRLEEANLRLRNLARPV